MVLLIVFLKEPLTAQQFFGVRLTMALAAAGIAAILPGFMRLEMSLAKSAMVRAGGAVAVFVLVMYFNPPIVAVINANALPNGDENPMPNPRLEVHHRGFLGNMRDHLNSHVSSRTFELNVSKGSEDIYDLFIDPGVSGATYGEIMRKICRSYKCLLCDPEPHQRAQRVTLRIKNRPLVPTADSGDLKRKKLRCP